MLTTCCVKRISFELPSLKLQREPHVQLYQDSFSLAFSLSIGLSIVFIFTFLNFIYLFLGEAGEA